MTVANKRILFKIAPQSTDLTVLYFEHEEEQLKQANIEPEIEFYSETYKLSKGTAFHYEEPSGTSSSYTMSLDNFNVGLRDPLHVFVNYRKLSDRIENLIVLDCSSPRSPIATDLTFSTQFHLSP